MADIADVPPGQTWAFRVSPSSSVFHEAVVLTVGSKSPPRVCIELTGDEWQGDRRRVSPARREVPWDDRAEYITVDAKFRGIRGAVMMLEDSEVVSSIFLWLIPFELAEFNSDAAGTTSVLEVAGLAAHLDVDEASLRAAPGFEHEGVLYVPWATTAAITRAAAAVRYPHRIREIEKAEQEFNGNAIDGTVVTDFDGEDYHLTSKDAEADAAPARPPQIIHR